MPFPLRRGWTPLNRSIGKMATSSISDSETKDFLSIIDRAKKITVLTGAGISAESGIPTFRGEGGLWRTWSATELATPEAFAADPSLVWEFYHYRRCVVTKAAPNFGHYAISALERKCKLDKKNFTLLTQNIDGLHLKAGTEEVVELHGSLWKTRCCTCGIVKDNFDMPICPALDGKGAPDPSVRDARIPTSMLPRCKECNGLLRPHVVWFGESLDRGIMGKAHLSLEECDLFIVAGTSAVVQPAAGFAPMVKYGGGTVVEFNIEDTPISRYCRFKFQGPCSKTLPLYLGIPVAELEERCKTKDFPIESL